MRIAVNNTQTSQDLTDAPHTFPHVHTSLRKQFWQVFLEELSAVTYFAEKCEDKEAFEMWVWVNDGERWILGAVLKRRFYIIMPFIDVHCHLIFWFLLAKLCWFLLVGSGFFDPYRIIQYFPNLSNTFHILPWNCQVFYILWMCLDVFLIDIFIDWLFHIKPFCIWAVPPWVPHPFRFACNGELELALELLRLLLLFAWLRCQGVHMRAP